MSAKSVILLAEDRDDDVELIRRAFREGKIDNPLFVVKNGEEAVAYLKGEGKYQTRDEYPLPDLLLLDLKMPRMDGFEVLRWVRLQPGFSSLLVVVLTSSEEIRDVNKAYQLGANSFLVKPHDFQQFAQTCYVLKEYWLNLNKGPEANRVPQSKSQQ
jgi:CheY-like chemotaxis protein